jgi:gliding motility-associated-like protein
MKKSYALLFILFCTFSVFATSDVKHKANFAEKDIFQTANFLKNVPGFITDYQGREIRYFASHDGVNVFLTDAGPIYELTQIDKKKLKELQKEKEREHKKWHGDKEEELESLQTIGTSTTVKWVGANPHPVIEPVNKSTGYFTFLTGKTEQDLNSIVTDGFKKVLYHDVYPGIDVEYSFPDKGGIKYNFIVHPGADMSRIQMEYGGAIKKLSKNADGNIIVHNTTGDLIEHMPVSYTGNGKAVASAYEIKGNTIRFSLPVGYDHSQTLIIDPWVTVLSQLTVRNLGSSVDYDVAGDLYVYGAGASYVQDAVNYQKVAKFDASGNFLWVFMGSVPSVSWYTLVGGYNELSNAKVDKVSNKVYMGQGFNYAIGNQIIRLTSAGVYDNFISVANINFQETWSIVSNCETGDILSLGGGTSSNLNMGVINPTSGIVSTSNITNVTGSYFQDIVSGAYDAFGNLYVVIASSATFNVDNYIYKCNPTYTGNVWGIPSGFNSFAELNNFPAFDISDGANSNNFNALDANGSYLYYYDGYNIAAYNLTTGALAGSTTIPAYTSLSQGGIAVDNCNHVYVGGQGVIKTFTFNGTTFTPGADIPLGGVFSNDTINDVRYDASNNLLYVAGSAIVGTYTATMSTSCSTISTLTAVVTPTCNQASVVVTPGTGLINPVFSYLWEDSLGNVLRQTTPDTILVDTLTGIGDGRYTVQVQLNVNCGGSTFIDTFHILCNNLVVSNDTTICSGQSVILSATGNPSGGTYSWTPGSGSTSSITVSPAASTTYFVTYTPPIGPPITDSVHVHISATTTVSVPDTTIICPGQNATITATPAIGGGTFSWSPGGGNTQTITVSPASSTIYTLTYTSPTCGIAVDSGLVLVLSAPTLTVTDATICIGGNASITATPSITGGTYSWSPGGVTTQTISVSPAITTTYTVTYSTLTCGTAVDSGVVAVTAGPTVSVNNDTICLGQNATLTATPSTVGGAYGWIPGGASSPSITVSPAINTTYTVTYSISGCSPVTAGGSVVVNTVPSATVATINADCTTPDGIAISQPTGGTAPYSYTWSNAAHTTTDTVTGLSANITYTVTVTDMNHCTASASGIVGLNLVSLTIVLDSLKEITCYGSHNGEIGVHVQNCPDCTYQWSNNADSADLRGLPPGVYTVTATNAAGCLDTVSYTITQPIQASLVILPIDTSIAENSTITLYPLFGPYPSSGITSYNWAPSTLISCNECPQPVFSSSTAGRYEYILTVDYNQGCVITDTVNVIVYSEHRIYVPNSFTPNSNGINDVFYIFPINAKMTSLTIFDRWGEKVFESLDEHIGWDGTYRGAKMPPGLYVYTVSATFYDGYTVSNKGSISLIR